MLNCQRYISQTKRQIQEVNTEEFFLNKDDFDIIIDVREPQETTQGTIPGACCIPRGVLETSLDSLVPATEQKALTDWLPTQKVLLYCRSGGRSALAAKSLQNMGLLNVFSLAGGIEAWCERGYPIIKTDSKE
ncbi:rhodanese-like domain-containing protein [Aliiglaciecola lipolytica]|uniref:Rhodanese-like protein n=1 Tax=Aliiglaciecola lipolytica E3 TaxID=1127673 RepID=K6WZJ1_9ALTE|nr:rhodanese-like domain-containing protein [Aliiglaciecola lipolytica]GAC13819.1 rhodanese-like protein [Aliiglaciecola lipolytica E3]